MSTQVIQILLALQNKGTSTYADLEKATDIPLNKLRWAVNDLKQRKLVIQKEDHISNAVAWQISPAGRTHLLEAVHKAERTKEQGRPQRQKRRPRPNRASPEQGERPQPQVGHVTAAAVHRKASLRRLPPPPRALPLSRHGRAVMRPRLRHQPIPLSPTKFRRRATTRTALRSGGGA